MRFIKKAVKTISKNLINAIKNIKLPSITNNSSYTLAMLPDTIADRRDLLEQQLSQLIGIQQYCFDLKDSVSIKKSSVKEIMFRASTSKESTLAALNLIDVIIHSKFIPPPTPPHGKTQASLHIDSMFELRCKIKRLGVVKLTIGQTEKGKIVYCITKFYFEKIK